MNQDKNLLKKSDKNDKREKINMLPIMENITKLIGAIVIIMLFVLFIPIFYKGSIFSSWFTKGLYLEFWEENFQHLTPGIVGRGDRWLVATGWTVFFLTFIAAMVSYVAYYIKDLIILINEIIRTFRKISNSVGDSIKESDLWKEDILGRTKREKIAKLIEEERKRQEKSLYDERLIPIEEEEPVKKPSKSKVKVEEEVAAKPKTKKLFDDFDEIVEEEIPEEIAQVLQEVNEKTNKEPEKEEKKFINLKDISDKSTTSELTDEEIDNLLKAQ